MHAGLCALLLHLVGCTLIYGQRYCFHHPMIYTGFSVAGTSEVVVVIVIEELRCCSTVFDRLLANKNTLLGYERTVSGELT